MSESLASLVERLQLLTDRVSDILNATNDRYRVGLADGILEAVEVVERAIASSDLGALLRDARSPQPQELLDAAKSAVALLDCVEWIGESIEHDAVNVQHALEVAIEHAGASGRGSRPLDETRWIKELAKDIDFAIDVTEPRAVLLGRFEDAIRKALENRNGH